MAIDNNKTIVMRRRETILNTMCILIFTLLLSTLSSQTYYSIDHGDWNDNTIWSMDGVNPCDCIPPYALDDENVVIRHEITSPEEISVHDGCTLKVISGCSLFCPENKFHVYGGELIAEGQVVLDEFYVYEGATAKLQSGSTINNVCHIEGSLEMMFPEFDTVHFMNSNFTMYENSDVTIENACLNIANGNLEDYGNLKMDACVVDLPNGNLYNYKTMTLGGTCITVTNGNVANTEGNAILGDGAINVLNGNIDNFGDWSTGVQWCASGSGNNLPLDEDCEQVDIICSNVALAMIFGDFWLTPEKNAIGIQWEAFSEEGMVQYFIERSPDGIEFGLIGTIEATTPSGESNVYQYIDKTSSPGLKYYRITAEDNEGVRTRSSIRSINYQPTFEQALRIYPNPVSESSQEVAIEGLPIDSEGQLGIFDLTGRKVHQEEVYTDRQGTKHGIRIESCAAGIYIVRFRNAVYDLSAKMIVIKR